MSEPHPAVVALEAEIERRVRRARVRLPKLPDHPHQRAMELCTEEIDRHAHEAARAALRRLLRRLREDVELA